MNRHLIPCVLTVALLAEFLPANEIVTVAPESVGMSAETLARIGPTMQRFVDEKKVAGAIAMVSRRGKVVASQAVGRLSPNDAFTMSPDTIVRIYSMSKPITSVAIMILVEEGKLMLDDPVSKHLPDLKGVQVVVGREDGQPKLADVQREMTIRDLLRHTSGLTYGFFGNSETDQQYRNLNVLDRNSTLADAVKKLGGLPLVDQPGARFRYSVSTDVLGRVVEVASGVSFDTFLQTKILKPLQMRDTAFQVPAAKRDRFAANYGPRETGGLRVIDAPASSRYLQPPKLKSGGGGLVSTARDYLRFCQMLLNEGELDGARILQRETVRAMTKDQLPKNAYPIHLGGKRDGVGFGLGFSVVVEKTPYTRLSRVGEYGWGGAASTHFWISPNDELAVVVLTQLMPFDFQLEYAVKPIVYEAILKQGQATEQ